MFLLSMNAMQISAIAMLPIGIILILISLWLYFYFKRHEKYKLNSYQSFWGFIKKYFWIICAFFGTMISIQGIIILLL